MKHGIFRTVAVLVTLSTATSNLNAATTAPNPEEPQTLSARKYPGPNLFLVIGLPVFLFCLVHALIERGE
jgi:hypothetical protein